MKYWAVCCLLLLSGCFIPMEWNRAKPTRWTGILIQSPIEVGSFSDFDLPWPWRPSPHVAFKRWQEQRAEIIAQHEAAEARRQTAEPSEPTPDPVQQATFLEEGRR